MKKNLFFTFFLVISLIILNSCGVGKKLKDFHKPVDLRNEPLDPDERARRNIEEGRGISLGKIGSNNTTYEFSTSNPMWRASLEVLDFIPLTTVDYSGGMIITDWYSDTSDNSKESLKISVRFLSNEIRSDSLKIIIHKKSCNTKGENCIVKKISSPKLEQTIRADIIKKATLLVKDTKKKKR